MICLASVAFKEGPLKFELLLYDWLDKSELIPIGRKNENQLEQLKYEPHFSCNFQKRKNLIDNDRA